jgi:hypothetical protein
MKKIIASLRLLGIVAFIVFIVLVLSRPFSPFTFSFTMAEKVCSLIAVSAFAVIMGIQLYRFYIGYYYKQKEDSIDA